MPASADKETLMPSTYRILILGASYGSLLATKLLLAGHTVKLVCLPDEADLINREGTRVRMPVKGREGPHYPVPCHRRTDTDRDPHRVLSDDGDRH